MSRNFESEVSGIVVLVPQHLFLLRDLLVGLNKDVALGQLVIVASGFSGGDAEKLNRTLKETEFSRPTVLVETPLQSAGANRNAGLSECGSGLVLFMDADDIYSPHRSKIALSLFAKHQFDLMLHGFTPFQHGDFPRPFPNPPKNLDMLPVVRESSLYQATLLRNPRNRRLELKGKTSTTNLLFNDPSEAFEVHHAHAIIRLEGLGTIRFHEEFGIRNEDGVFARDMLEARKRVLLTPFALSAYRHGVRAKPKKSSHSV